MSKQSDIDRLDRAITDILANAGLPPSLGEPSLAEPSLAEPSLAGPSLAEPSLAGPSLAGPSLARPSLAGLLSIARDLAGMPRPDFKARLRSELERTTSVSAKTVHFREGFRTVTPYISVPQPEELIEFVHRVFGAVETGRSTHSSGALHAEVRIGDSMLMIGGGSAGPRHPHTLRVLVENADDVYRQALDAGAISTLAMTEGYGERFGCVRDPFGNQWIISTQIGPSYSEGLDHTITTFIYARGASKFIDFMKRAFGATELMRADGPEGQVRHSVIRIGDSVVAASDPRVEEPSPVGLYLYVPDVDTLFQRAVQAGAEPTSPPTDHAYGDRGAAVTDAWGNGWYMATPLQR